MADAAPQTDAAQTEEPVLTVEETEVLEALLKSRITEMEKKNGKKFTEEEINQVRKSLYDTLTSQEKTEQMVSLVQKMKGEEGMYFRRMNFTIGLPGAVALMTSLIKGTDLTPKRKEHFIRKIKAPDDLSTKTKGGLTIQFPRQRKQFSLHGGECAPNHDFGEQISKVEALATKEEMERIRAQCSFVFEFTRKAYVRLVEVNRHFLTSDIIPKYEGTKIVEGIDESNSTIYLQVEKDGSPPRQLEPRVGLFFTEVEFTEEDEAA